MTAPKKWKLRLEREEYPTEEDMYKGLSLFFFISLIVSWVFFFIYLFFFN